MAHSEIFGSTATLFLGDAGEILKTLPANSVDSIVSDPPSGTDMLSPFRESIPKDLSRVMDFDVSLGRSRSGFSNTNKFNLRHRENFVASVWPTLVESARILKPGGYGVFWGLHRTLHWLSWGLEESGLSVLDILMRKVARQRLKSPFVKGAFSTQLVRETESWVLVRKDGETTARENQEKWGTGYLNIGEGKLSNLLEGHLVNRHETDHPSEKSLGWMGELVQLVTPVGGRVLDPFMGSGSTGVSAIENGFKFLGVEKEERWFKVASQRIRAATDSNSILDLMSL